MSWTPTILIRVDEKLKKILESEKIQNRIDKWIRIKNDYEYSIKNAVEEEMNKLEEFNRELENPLSNKDLETLVHKKTEELRSKLWIEFSKKRDRLKGWLLDKICEIKRDINNEDFVMIEGQNYTYVYTEFTREAKDLISFLKENNITYVVIGE